MNDLTTNQAEVAQVLGQAIQNNIVKALNHIQVGSSFVGITTLTAVKLKGGQKNPLQGKVFKRMTGGNVMVFTNTKSNGYENMVKRRLIAEGMDAENFQLGKLAWGNHVPNSPFIFHKGKMYLQVIFMKTPAKVEYLVDGEVTPKEDIPGLDDEKSEGEQGGLVNKVIIRTYKTESIKEIRVDGQEFKF